jgi:hypothetical protein
MNPFLRAFTVGVTAAGILLIAPAGGQDPIRAWPRVVRAGIPFYPPLAQATHVYGTVHVRVTTDGQNIVATHVEDGPKLLVDATEKNIQSWELSKHEPTSFVVTFVYKLKDDSKSNPNGPTIVLRMPTEVEVSATPLVIRDPSPDIRPK